MFLVTCIVLECRSVTTGAIQREGKIAQRLLITVFETGIVENWRTILHPHWVGSNRYFIVFLYLKRFLMEI